MLSFTLAMDYNERMQVDVRLLNDVVETLGAITEELLALGDRYRYGTASIKPDVALAESYYREAAELGDWEGMRLLAAVLEEQGRSSEAEAWLMRAASEGDEQAEDELHAPRG